MLHTSPRIRRGLLAGVVILALVAGPVCGAATTAGPALDPAATAQVREELRLLMMDLVQNGTVSDAELARLQFSVDTPAQRVSTLGVLVDSGGPARNGLQVLGVTPGGAAERMGLRTGDVLLAVNGQALSGLGVDAAGHAIAPRTLRDEVTREPAGATLQLQVLRDGRTQVLSGPIASVNVPAMRLLVGSGASAADAAPVDPAAAAEAGCGRISIFDVAPRQQQLHAAVLIAIDGQLPGVTGQTEFRVAPGMHTLTVAERIESRYLTINDRQRNAGNNYKKLTIEVAPNTTYFIAARLNADKATQWNNGAYWDPVMWKQVAEACR